MTIGTDILTLTADGTTPTGLVCPNRKDALLHISGDFGGGSLTINVANRDGDTVALGDPWTAGDAMLIETGSAILTFTMAGATSPDVKIQILRRER